jgi:hypothetical protein
MHETPIRKSYVFMVSDCPVPVRWIITPHQDSTFSIHSTQFSASLQVSFEQLKELKIAIAEALNSAWVKSIEEEEGDAS